MNPAPEQLPGVQPSAASDDSLQRVHDHLLHTKPEKPHGYSATPLVILGLMCTVVFFGSIYLAHYSARFDPLAYNENAKPSSGKIEAPVITPAMLGKRVYTNVCMTCHQQNGMGVAGVYPPLAGSDWAQGSEERIIRIVLHGLNGPITVSGKEINSAMAPLGAVLKDDQIANALSYVRQEWGNSAPEVRPETVARIRAETASRTQPWTAPELLKIGN
jgi:mono/diheme cytochrome c family protein